MAYLICGADGNLTSSGTWRTVDSSVLVTEGGTSANTLTTASLASANFAPGAVEVDALALRFSSRATGVATSSLTAVLYDATSSSAVVTLTIPVADIPVGGSSELNRPGWMLFSLGAPVTLEAGKNYQIRLQLSATTPSVAVCTNGTTNNWQHMLRTTTATAPSAGDNMYVIGLWTASATWTQYTVTQDQTTTGTVYGSNPGSGDTQSDLKSGLHAYKSSIVWPTTSSTAIAIAGNLHAGPGGIISIGTSGSPVQRGYTATVVFATTSGYGPKVGCAGTLSLSGESLTTGSRVFASLNSDISSGSTASFNVNEVTGWTSGSTVYLSSTRPGTATDSAEYTLAADAGTNSMQFTGAVTANHSGSAGGYPFPGMLVLTSGFSVVISSDVNTRYCELRAKGNVTLALYPSLYVNWANLRYAKVYVEVMHDGFTLTNSCVDHKGTSVAASTQIIRFDGTHATGAVTLSNIGIVHGSAAWSVYSGLSGTADLSGWTIEDIVSIHDGTSLGGSFLLPVLNIGALRRIVQMGRFGGITLQGFTSTTYWNPPADLLSGSRIMGVGDAPLSFGNYGWRNMVISNVKGVASTSSIYFGAYGVVENVVVRDCELWTGRYIVNMAFDAYHENTVFERCVFGGFTPASQTPSAWFSNTSFQSLPLRIKMLGCTFSNSLTTPITTSGIVASGWGNTTGSRVHLQLSVVPGAPGSDLSSMAWTTGSLFTPDSFISITDYNGVADDNRVYRPYTLNGTAAWSEMPSIRSDSTVYRTAAPSERMLPKTTGSKFESSVKRFAVTSGSTASITVYVRKDSTYDGAAPRLVLKRHYVAGYQADQVLDSHSAAADAWDDLTSTIGPLTRDVVLEVVVDCDGTTGSIYIDDWSAA